MKVDQNSGRLFAIGASMVTFLASTSITLIVANIESRNNEILLAYSIASSVDCDSTHNIGTSITFIQDMLPRESGENITSNIVELCTSDASTIDQMIEIISLRRDSRLSSDTENRPNTPNTRPPGNTNDRNPPDFIAPVQGLISRHYGTDRFGRLDGIRIVSECGTPVLASAGGEVVYSGNELQGYGQLVLIRHAGNWVTAYGLLNTRNVSVGDVVTSGSQIGTVGTSRDENCLLHFEVRDRVTPIDPLSFIEL